MEKKDIFERFPRRVLNKKSITIPDASLSVRYLINRTAKGLPVNAHLTKHIPLPPDGIIDDDYETGVEDIADVTDAVKFMDKIKAEQEYIKKKQDEAHQEALGKVEMPPSTNSEATQ